MLSPLSYSPSLYSFYHPLPYGDVRTDFSVLYDSWPFNYSFIHSLNRPLFSTNHMQAPRTQRSKMLILVLINVTVHYISSLTLLFCSGNTPCPHCHFPCVTFPALLTSFQIHWVSGSSRCGVLSCTRSQALFDQNREYRFHSL